MFREKDFSNQQTFSVGDQDITTQPNHTTSKRETRDKVLAFTWIHDFVIYQILLIQRLWGISAPFSENSIVSDLLETF